MILKLIGCNALRRELCSLAALSPHEIEPHFLAPNDPEALRRALSEPTDAAYILLGFGLCAAEGLTATHTPLVVPAAHDCAHLLLGDGARYRRAFSENDDAPRWRSPVGCRSLDPGYGTPCAVVSPFGPRPVLPEGAREYAADLTWLRDLVNGLWDERFLVLEPGLCLRASPTRRVVTAEPSETSASGCR